MSASAQEVSVPAAAVPPAVPADPGVVIERFEFHYGLENPKLPDLVVLNQVNVRLVRDGGLWRAPTGDIGEILTLGNIPAGSRFDAGALRIIAQELVRWYNARDLFGVWVAFQDLEATSSGLLDQRKGGDHTARLVVWASQIAEVRTLARGKRFKPQFSVNNPKHKRLITKSPLQPGSLFRQSLLNDYLHGLSLHPGRLLEASIASAGEPGKVVLDFLVNESKQWQIFSQVTNFGTESTGIWRGRLGFQDNQLTNHDDVLNIDAISTPDFKTYGSFLSYRFPVLRPAKLLARVYGSYGDFIAGTGGDSTLQQLRFAGKNWIAGMEFTNSSSLPRDWEIVTALGANYDHYQIQSEFNGSPLVGGFSNFLVPFLSTTLSHDRGWWRVGGSLRYDKTLGSFANRNTSDGISALGRISADADWASLRWNVSGMMFLEPLFFGTEKARYEANQLSLSVRGRKLLTGANQIGRLIPQEQEPIGGALSVRGYPESVLSADEFVASSFEYAFHFPHTLKPGEPGTLFRQPFKWRPDKPQRAPDWDLVLRAFYDFAYRQVTPAPLNGQPAPTTIALVDKNLTISGVGAGMELVVKQNLSLRCDVGMALDELRDDTLTSDNKVVVPAGQIHVYLSSTFSW
ncbi:MAG: hypothetical protein JWQ83_199 [Lacunisphaera sp.]|nr:hypothetical protein [Lacunisphaera sp.]MDB6165059.1 hypothetical protein [Lacunisphaera sp.]